MERVIMRIFVIILSILVSISAFSQKKKKKDQDFEPLDVTELSESEVLKVETMLIEAEKELILENYNKAYDLFKAALKLSPNNPTLNFKAAEVLAKNGDHQNALAFATKAMELDPRNKYYLLLAAEIHKTLSNFSNAAKIYQQMIDNIEGTESYLFDLALIYQYQGEYDKALAAYEEAEDYYGVNEIVLREKQKIYLKREDYDGLIADWDELIAENPGEPRYTIELCEFLISQNLMEEAKERLISLKQNNHANLLLSQIALAEGDTQKAIELANNTFKSTKVDYNSKLQLLNNFLAVAITPEDFDMLTSLSKDLAEQYPDKYEVQAFTGDVMYRLEQKEEAREYYLKAIKLSPSNYSVWQNILNIEAGLNQYDSVIKHAEEALEYFPNQGILYYFAGTGYLVEKNYRRSVQVLDQGKKYVTDPKLLSIFYGQLGDAYNSLKQYDKSYTSYEKALETDPDNDHVLNNYSYYLSLRNRDMDKALEMSTKLVEMHPDNPTYLDTHGWVLYTLGKYSEAVKYLEKAANLEPDGTVVEHFGDVLYKLGRVDEAVAQWKRASGLKDASENIEKKIAGRKLYE